MTFDGRMIVHLKPLNRGQCYHFPPTDNSQKYYIFIGNREKTVEVEVWKCEKHLEKMDLNE